MRLPSGLIAKRSGSLPEWSDRTTWRVARSITSMRLEFPAAT